MESVIDILERKISTAIAKVTGRTDCVALVKPTADPKFGDYQANGIMALAKKLKTNPRKLAEQVVEKLKLDDICQPPQIAGPGFINLKLKESFIAGTLLKIKDDITGRLDIDKVSKPQTIVVDFSGPNIAKQMHVGHLRSTIIGDCICRLLEFKGHNVIRQNHIGDWGTQFGMLCAYLENENPQMLQDHDSVHITDLEDFYKKAKTQYDRNDAFAEVSRQQVVNLHNHDKETLKVWRHIVDESRSHYQPIYNFLGVNLHKDNERGESFYADKLGGVVEDLKKLGLAEKSDGAICVFPEGFTNKEGQPLPFIIQKSDGAFLYATTDLAAVRYRINNLKADEIIYVTDARQKLHFAMLFEVVEQAAWAKKENLTHITFGTMLGEDGTPFKTRSGDNVKLKDLLQEAVERAKAVVEQKNPDLPAAQKAEIAKAVGIGAVKYADYSNNRESDYVFSFDKMLAMEGNTAPYMQYAYARVRSIERKAAKKDLDIESELASATGLNLTEPEELDLAGHLIRYGEAIASAAKDYRPNYLTSYLYELSQKFSSFYAACPVLDADETKRPTRLLLCDLTAKTIEHGLGELLGIETVGQM